MLSVSASGQQPFKVAWLRRFASNWSRARLQGYDFSFLAIRRHRLKLSLNVLQTLSCLNFARCAGVSYAPRFVVVLQLLDTTRPAQPIPTRETLIAAAFAIRLRDDFLYYSLRLGRPLQWG
jgi:hypothetical protein